MTSTTILKIPPAQVEFKAIPPSTSTASAGIDPRTTASLVLFEEFVPLEYRQKLAQSSSTRRRLPSLFTPKSKQWKPAATLNGKPYEVGHVPRSPTYREVEFEGLLHGDNATKVISLAAPAPRASMLSTTGVSILSTAGADPTVTPRSEYQLPPLPPKHDSLPPPPLPPKNGSLHSVESTPSSKRVSRFRLPTNPALSVPTPSMRRKSGVPPAQYSIVEFETRLASYSDDEHNSPNETESAKQRRRQSKDDAWVDILVGGTPRLLVGEPDAGKRRSLRETHSDPDLASMEVAQVLAAAVKNRPPSPPSVVERVDRVDLVDRDFGMDLHVLDLDVEEVETVPRTSDATTQSSEYSGQGENGDAEDNNGQEHDTEEEGGEGLKEAVMKARLRARRGRPGYFDLHPERLNQVHSLDIEEELKAKLAQDDDMTDEEPEGGEAAAAAAPVAVAEVTSVEKTPVQETNLDLPQEEGQPAQHQHQQETNGVATAATEATGLTNGHDATPETPKHALPQSRTAALIEMYRERERGAGTKPAITISTVPQVVNIPPAPVITPSASPALPASRIPVKLQKEPVPVTVPAPEPEANEEPQSQYEEPKQIALEEFSERPSPGRYIHGAPLHNVIEEEEEED